MNEIRTFKEVGRTAKYSRQSGDAGFNSIVDKVVELGEAGIAKHFSNKKLVDVNNTLSVKEYRQLNNDVRKMVLGYMAQACNMECIEDAQDLETVFSNPVGQSLYNRIMTSVLPVLTLGCESSAISQLADVVTVDYGDSHTFYLEPKGLNIVQRDSRMSNRIFNDSQVKQTVTITPKVYSAGVQIDYIRMLDRTFDFGREVAKLAMSFIYSQYKLVVSLIFDSAQLNGTLFYNSSYVPATFLKQVEALKAVNGGRDVINYGTLPAFYAISGNITNNYGFASQDEVIRNGYLGRVHGVDSFVVDNVTDGSEYVDNSYKQLALPMDMILTLSPVSDKPVKLVRENFVKVVEVEPTEGGLYRHSFGYQMAYDAGIATTSNYMLTKVA